MKYECFAKGCKALGDCNRIKILQFLKDGEKCVCEIHEKLKLPQNLVSHHLATLRKAKLIQAKRSGKWMRYSLNKVEIKKITNSLSSLI